MSDTFDPYYEWLGIPKQEQPASAYRLLGISDFEHDGAVIANAADRTMKHLRTYQAGKRSQISQKLLNEVANAKITLLDEKSKAQYDAELAVEFQASKKSLEETVTPPPQINKEPFVEDNTKAIESIAKGNQSSRGRRQRRGNKAPTRPVQRIIFISVGVLAMIMLSIAVLLLSRFKRQREARNYETQRTADTAFDRFNAKKKKLIKAERVKAEREAKEQAERIAKIEAERKAKAKRKAEEEAQRKAIEETAKRRAERTIEVEYWPNGQKKSEANFKDGEFDGLVTEWHENGQKKSEANFKDGKQDGLWTEWHENGQKEYVAHFKNGKNEGFTTWWYENGQKNGESHWKNGEPDGLMTWWYENGKKKSEGHWKNGKLVTASAWKPDGDPCPETKIVDGSGINVSWYENGQKEQKGHWKDSEQDGLWQFWYSNGQKEYEGHYKNGKEDGLVTKWYENGQKKVEIHYKDGREISRKEF